MTNDNDSINYCDTNQFNEEGNWFAGRLTTGLTKREYFAAMALQGLISKYNLKEPGDQITIAQMAIELADTFINELNKS